MKKALALAAVAALGLAAQANAAQITVTTGPIAAYDNATNFNSVPFNPTLNLATKGVLYEIPVNFQVSGLAAGQAFGNIAFDVSVTGSTVPDQAAGSGGPYAPSPETYTSGKQHPNYYSINGDQGSSTNDLQGIVASFPAGTLDAPRAAAGTSGPFLIGYVYVDLPANAASNGKVQINVTGWSTSDAGVLTQQSIGSITQPAALNFIVPEPASMGLVGLGGLALAARRRRQA